MTKKRLIIAHQLQNLLNLLIVRLFVGCWWEPKTRELPTRLCRTPRTTQDGKVDIEGGDKESADNASCNASWRENALQKNICMYIYQQDKMIEKCSRQLELFVLPIVWSIYLHIWNAGYLLRDTSSVLLTWNKNNLLLFFIYVNSYHLKHLYNIFYYV